MKIALIKSALARLGGAEKIAWRLAQRLAHEHELFFLTTGSSLDYPGIETFALHQRRHMSTAKVREFDAFCTQQLNQIKPDIIYGCDRTCTQHYLRAGNGVHAAYLKRRAQTEGTLKRLSFSLNPLHKLQLEIEKKAFESPLLKKLFVNSQMVKKEVLSNYSVDPSKIEVVYNGVEWEEWEAPFEESLSQKREEPFRLLFVGHNYERKGLRPLLHALAMTGRKDVHLYVIGKEKRLCHFVKLARSLGLEKQVFFLGETSPLSYYQMADVVALPTLYDPFANVTIEALAMGCFVLTSKSNGGSEILTEKSGTVIEDLSSYESVAESLEIALRHPKTENRAREIRSSVKSYDFANQLPKLLCGLI